MTDIFLVTGATGAQGGAVAQSLLARGKTVRALVRDPNKDAAKALQDRGVELAVGSYDDSESLKNAMKNVHGVFSLQNFFETGFDKEVQQGKQIADIAKQSGVKHLVYSSVIGADRKSGVPHFESKWLIEEHIRAVGIPHTMLRAVAYMENIPNFQWFKDGKLYIPMHPTKDWQLISTKDIGEFAAIAFTNSSLLNKALEIAGDQLTMIQAAETFTRVLGSPVTFQEQSIVEVRAYNEELALMFEWFNNKANYADLDALRKLHPGLMTLESWLRQSDLVKQKQVV
ncbi:MAG TPA: NmrA/HSCARG family protein [Drouetiella sp.]